MFRKSFLISYFLFFISYSSFSQKDSCHIRISLLTCSPGEELYSTFGHSALRITDSVTDEDIVYNYGTFNFDEPGFYTKFIRGKLLYYLSTQDFNSFKQDYQEANRGMTEQVLNLSCNEKQRMVELLHRNLMNENRFYKYDFLFDNCTTRLRDLLEKAADTTVHFTKIVREGTTFRDHIFEYMDYNDKQWTKLGMDVLLGNTTDKIMNNQEAMFLPDYLLKGFDSAHIGNKPVVFSKQKIIDFTAEKPQKNIYTHPVFIFWILFGVIALLTLSNNKSAKKLLYGFDGFLFFIIGFAGILILVMWFGTEHIVCRNNFNILWALPTHAVIAFFINSKKEWVKKYFLMTVVISMLVLLAWYFLPQPLNPAFIPIVFLIILRSIANGRKQVYSI